MALAAGALRLKRHNVIPLATVPSRITQRRNVGAGTAINVLGGLAAVTKVMPRANLALKPSGVSTNRWWQAVSQSQPLALLNGFGCHFLVVLKPLGVYTVIVLTDGNIQRTFQ